MTLACTPPNRAKGTRSQERENGNSQGFAACPLVLEGFHTETLQRSQRRGSQPGGADSQFCLKEEEPQKLSMNSLLSWEWILIMSRRSDTIAHPGGTLASGAPASSAASLTFTHACWTSSSRSVRGVRRQRLPRSVGFRLVQLFLNAVLFRVFHIKGIKVGWLGGRSWAQPFRSSHPLQNQP